MHTISEMANGYLSPLCWITSCTYQSSSLPQNSIVFNLGLDSLASNMLHVVLHSPKSKFIGLTKLTKVRCNVVY